MDEKNQPANDRSKAYPMQEQKIITSEMDDNPMLDESRYRQNYHQ
jgi:hypothetical protein